MRFEQLVESAPATSARALAASARPARWSNISPFAQRLLDRLLQVFQRCWFISLNCMYGFRNRSAERSPRAPHQIFGADAEVLSGVSANT